MSARSIRFLAPFCVTLLAFAASPALATFHLMQIEQVMGGVNRDVQAQAIQLRMRASFQNFLSPSRIRAWDAMGMNPVVIVDFATNVPNGSTGDRVLAATPSFLTYYTPGLSADFTMNPIPSSYLAAGSLTFEDDSGNVYWRLSWGGAAYTGSGAVLLDNDGQGDGTFNPPFPSGLPFSDLQAVRCILAATAGGTSNAADYALTISPATFTNNARVSRTVTGLPGCSVAPGIDLFATVPGATYQDMSLPGGFFGPGSDPFAGRVYFQGVPLGPGPLGPTDTVVERLDYAILPGPNTHDVIPIEIVALSLVSVAPITVTYNGGMNPEQWDVRACLSSAATQQPGTMTVKTGPCACTEGGTFDSVLPVLPRLTFNRIGPPATQVLDFGAVGMPPIQFSTGGGRWLPSDPGFSIIQAPPGASVDHDCNAATPPIMDLPPTTNFFPGLRVEHCGAGGCGDPAVHMKRLTQEQAQLAAHGVLPPQPCGRDIDADRVCDDADNCPNLPNPDQRDFDGDGVGDPCDNCGPRRNPCQEDVNPPNGIGDICEVAAVEDEPAGGGLWLSAPAPNPTRGTLAYTVVLPRASQVRIALFDLRGRLMLRLLDGPLSAGRHDLTASLADGRLPSGRYFLRLEADGQQLSRSFTLTR